MEMVTVLSILGLVICLLVFDLLRVDVVGLLVMTLLPLAGILTANEAVAGLGSSAVVVLISVMVLGAALYKTGLVQHGFTKQFGLYVAYTPIRNLPATFLYCCPVTVLEWEFAHAFILTPVTMLTSLISH